VRGEKKKLIWVLSQQVERGTDNKYLSHNKKKERKAGKRGSYTEIITEARRKKARAPSSNSTSAKKPKRIMRMASLWHGKDGA